MKIKVDIEFIKIKEDTQYEYLIPEFPLSLCRFNKLDQKCRELKECLPEDVVDVHVPTLEEAERIPEEIRACCEWWWTASMSPSSSSYAYYVYTDGNINYNYVSYSFGFRPIITRRKY